MFKRICKTVCILLAVTVVMLSAFAISVGAVSAKSTIGLTNKTPKVNSTVTVTVTFVMDTKMQAIEGALKFDSSKLQYVSAGGDFTSNTNNAKDGSIDFLTTGNSDRFSEEYTFKVIAEGDALVRLSGKCSDGTAEYTVAPSSYTIKISGSQTNNDTTQQDTNSSTKAALKSIKVAAGTLTPAFKENITEYTVVVPYSQTDGLLTCDTLDKGAKVSVEGERELKVGLNKRTIIVVASNGETRRYNVTFNRLDENGNDITAAQTDSNSVLIDNKEFVIVQNDSSVVVPKGFSLTTTTYEEKEIAVYSDATGKITIAYLKAKDESEEGFYLLENGKLTKFCYIECAEVCYVIKEDNGTAPEGFYKSTYEHNGVNIPCFKYTSQDYADFIVVSAVTTSGGEGYYRYDVKENTMQRYSEFTGGIFDGAKEEVSVVTAPVRLTAIVLCVIFALGIIALIVLIIIKLCSLKKVNDEIIEEGYTIEMNSDTPEDKE